MKSFLNELKDNLSFIIFYGSQLGQAKSIAEGLVDVAEEFNFQTQCFELNVVKDVNDLTKLSCPIVIVTSSTGDGEPPENADKFWRKIRKKNLTPGLLQKVQFTLLGLGDTNYNNFCNCGKVFNKRFLELGATQFYDPGWADDAVGLELVVDDWIDNLWPALESLIRPNAPKMATTALSVPACPPLSLSLSWIEDNLGAGDAGSATLTNLLEPLAPYPLIDGDPVKMTISKAQVLTHPSALKTALELTLQFQDKPFTFQPGDAVNLVCPNSLSEVDCLLARLSLQENADKTLQLSVKPGAKGKIPPWLPATVKVREAFLYYLDIRSCPKKNFFRLLSEFTSDSNEKAQLLHLSSRQGSATFEETIRFAALSLLDILLTFPSCTPPVEVLLEHLPRLLPRAYSISSSPLENAQKFTTVFNVVAIPKEKGRQYERLGVCTGWLLNKCKSLLKDKLEENMNSLSLEDKQSDTSLEVVAYRRKNQTFHLPEDNGIPVIMVGPGTGVAPFLGFLQHRAKMDGTQGEMALYYGCRHKDKDFLYKEQLTKLEEKGLLTRFRTVFSRDNSEEKVRYVQHKMEEEEEMKWVLEVMEANGGYLYVCGDARNMAKDVRETLIKGVMKVRGMEEPEAKKVVAEWTTQKRYLQDVWT